MLTSAAIVVSVNVYLGTDEGKAGRRYGINCGAKALGGPGLWRGAKTGLWQRSENTADIYSVESVNGEGSPAGIAPHGAE